MLYSDYFRIASRDAQGLGGAEPLGYQQRYHDRRKLHSVLSVPTGLGKTDAVLVDWLHRVQFGDPLATRRLAWTLPGRALADQVAKVASLRVNHLRAAAGLPEIRVLLLMGGSEDNDLTLAPDEPAILVGTQDILISRALNRGYARNPFRWPIDYALLNNDITWVFDEVQLLGEALATSSQLAGFRERLQTFGKTPSVWMSATMQTGWLATVDFAKGAQEAALFAIEAAEVASESVTRERWGAPKELRPAPVECRMPAGCARFALERRRESTLSLIVANTVERARDVYAALAEAVKGGKGPETVLLHSRFRPDDRKRHVNELLAPVPPEGRIVVSTQVIEAGIDVSAALMITDAAPYASMVQRFGRVNRRGEMRQPAAEIFWVDRPLKTKRKAWSDAPELKPNEEEEVYAPYDAAEAREAIELLRGLRSAAPADLPAVTAAPPWKHVLRRADLMDLFDTTPDLGGNQIDISRFVRSGEDLNVYVAWREAPDCGGEVKDVELCPAPIGEARKFAEKHEARQWDAIAGRWAAVEHWRPGITVVFRAGDGGYTAALGWSPDTRERVTVVEHEKSEAEATPEATPDDRLSYERKRQTLVEHTDEVAGEMRRLLDSLTGMNLERFRPALENAARKHDWGKAHFIMQDTLHGGKRDPNELLAKSERKQGPQARHARRYFRHELASALAMLQSGESDLCVYVVAAHHGRIRMGLRSMTGEREGGKEYTRGIGEGDALPAVDFGGGAGAEAITLHLGPMCMGSEDGVRSWADRTAAVLDELGPFRLAYLEMLLRMADERASARAAGPR